jgi:hypothetical protein
MNDFSLAFEERLQEIEAYLNLLEALEQQIQEGVPQFGENGPRITVQQQKILYSSVYLQLYNLVESTVTRCVDAISETIIQNQLHPSQLSINLQKIWVKSTARTNVDLNDENRLNSAFRMYTHLVQSLPISIFEIEKGGGGSWDDTQIEAMSTKLGLSLRISPDIYSKIKRKFRDELKPLTFIMKLRNSLAHGSISFAECSDEVTVRELRELTNLTASYLRQVVACFKSSIDNNEFLLPKLR